MFNEGISKMGDLLDIGVTRGFVKKAGSFYSYEDTRLGQGRENSKNFLSERSDIAEAIEALIRGDGEPSETPPGDVDNGHHLLDATGTTAHMADADSVSLN
jgi:recombination protein RecA